MHEFLNQLELNEAFRQLFGAPAASGLAALEALDLRRLKSCFRKWALAIHPDRLDPSDPAYATKSELFGRVTGAYSTLKRYIELRQTGALRWAPPPAEERAPAPRSRRTRQPPPSPRAGESRRGPRGQTHNGDHFWTSGPPTRRLLFGEYLYFTGKVSWKTFVQAVRWQRSQRPAFGSIARHWGYLDDQQLADLVASQSVSEAIGEAALRLGLLTPYQRAAVVGKQRQLQRPLGEYFLLTGLLTAEQLKEAARDQRAHNSAPFSSAA